MYFKKIVIKNQSPPLPHDPLKYPNVTKNGVLRTFAEVIVYKRKNYQNKTQNHNWFGIDNLGKLKIRIIPLVFSNICIKYFEF